jgi:predicted transcriptional regulator
MKILNYYSYIFPPKFSNFYTSISKNCGECEMQLINSGFNNIHNEWQNSYANINSSKRMKIFTNAFKYKCEALNCCMCYNIY